MDDDTDGEISVVLNVFRVVAVVMLAMGRRAGGRGGSGRRIGRGSGRHTHQPMNCLGGPTEGGGKMTGGAMKRWE